MTTAQPISSMSSHSKPIQSTVKETHMSPAQDIHNVLTSVQGTTTSSATQSTSSRLEGEGRAPLDDSEEDNISGYRAHGELDSLLNSANKGHSSDIEEAFDERNDTLGLRAIPPTRLSRILSHLWRDVDANRTTIQMVAFCFMTGFIGCVSFSVIFMHVAFQTGNSIQIAIAIARPLQGSSAEEDGAAEYFQQADRQALTSLVAFNLGAFLGRVGDRVGCLTRMWMVFGTLLQALLTLAATVVLWRSSIEDDANPPWSDMFTFVGIAFLSASMGLQGIMGKRLNTQFSTTVVLTSAWLELITDPNLFKFGLAKTRDHRLMGIGSLFVGAFVGRALLGRIGAVGTLGVGTVLRFIIALNWVFVPVVHC